MKRAGFTMIELIFVIVILGILAAVALPKFAGVSDQANAQKCKAFTGTLNRTVGPSMWSEAIDDSNGSNGAVSGGGALGTILPGDYIAADNVPPICVSTDGAIVTNANVIFAGATQTTNGTGALTNSIQGIAFGSNTYDFQFYEGNASDSPRWVWMKN